MADLTTLAAVKDWLGIAGQSDDALLARLISGVSAAAQNYINRTIATGSYAETRDGTGGTRLFLSNYPVLGVTSVVVGGITVLPSSDGFNNAGYVADSRGITMIGRYFDRGLGNVQVSYTAGYAQTPFDLEQAVIEWVAFRYRERDRIGHASKSIAGETVAFLTGPMPSGVKLTLDQFRKVVPLR